MSGNVKILLLEDSALDAELIRAQLGKVGASTSITRVVTRKEFENAVAACKPDLILSDYSLPDFDGMTAFAIAQERCPEIPFIFVSGTLGEDIAIDALHRGATDYVLKQRLDRLAPSISRALHENELKRQQRASQEALRASQLRFRELADAMSQFLWATDSAGSLNYANRWARENGDRIESGTEVAGLGICHSEDCERLRSTWKECLATGSALDLECRLRFSDGSYRWHLCRFQPMHDSAGRLEGWIASAVDVEEQKHREESLRASETELRGAKENLEAQVEERTRAYAVLSARLLNLQDEERRRVARDLHDGFGQILVALKINLDLLSMDSMTEMRRSQIMENSRELLDKCLTEMRTMSYLLHPPLLDETGFSSAAHWYVKGFAERSGIQAELHLPSELGRLSPEIEVTLFRVLQASLTNVHRHAGARKVDVTVRRDHERVEMIVHDNGKGIPEEKLKALRRGGFELGVGLAGMRERVRDLNGSLTITADSGTAVVVRIPLGSTSADSQGNSFHLDSNPMQVPS